MCRRLDGIPLAIELAAARVKVLSVEQIDVAREAGHKRVITIATWSLGVVAICQGQLAAARLFLEESLAVLREVGEKRGLCRALEAWGILAAAQGQAQRAARLLGSAEALRETIGAPLAVSDRAHYDYDRYAASIRSLWARKGWQRRGRRAAR